MRKSLALVLTAAAWAVTPTATTAVVAGSLATAVLAGSAQAGTALLPGWKHSCGRDPRCFERGEYRRQMARLRSTRPQ